MVRVCNWHVIEAWEENINTSLITGKSLVGECLSRTTLGVEKMFREIREIYAQSVPRAGFFEE